MPCSPDGADDVIPPTIEWVQGASGSLIRLIDQRLLPGKLVIREITTVDELCDAITTLTVRGAPALGAAGAMGVALAFVNGEDPVAAGGRLCATRPTAVNLSWGVQRALAAPDPVVVALGVAAEDVVTNRRLSALGAALLPEQARVLTHCNAGALACVGYGTAVGVIRAAASAGGVSQVWVDETRPLLQGARLTAWELGRLGIAHRVVVDAAAGSLMAAGLVDCVVVGADRIAANGDVANKIGTYGLAVLARHHRIPFYVAAPLATVDSDSPTGADIPIEERRADEIGGVPLGTSVFNPAFDVTPAGLVTAVVTEAGVVRPVTEAGLTQLLRP